MAHYFTPGLIPHSMDESSEGADSETEQIMLMYVCGVHLHYRRHGSNVLNRISSTRSCILSFHSDFASFLCAATDSEIEQNRSCSGLWVDGAFQAWLMWFLRTLCLVCCSSSACGANKSSASTHIGMDSWEVFVSEGRSVRILSHKNLPRISVTIIMLLVQSPGFCVYAFVGHIIYVTTFHWVLLSRHNIIHLYPLFNYNLKRNINIEVVTSACIEYDFSS